jgi:hypothetical protein
MKPHLIALLLLAACGGGGSAYDEAVDDLCDKFEARCGGLFASTSACRSFYQQVHADLEARCDDPAPIQDAYATSLSCVAAAIDANGCSVLVNACGAERDAYEALLAADNPMCEPDDD